MPTKRTGTRLQCDNSAASALRTTRLSPLQCRVTQQHDATVLAECSVAGDMTRRVHAAEDIICYS
jgi:hypothetical protein